MFTLLNLLVHNLSTLLGKRMDSESPNDDNTPHWKYVIKLGKAPRRGGNWNGDAIIVMRIIRAPIQKVKGHLKYHVLASNRAKK